MGVLIRQIIYDDKPFFVGFSTVTNRYFTRAYTDIAPLLDMKDGNSSLFNGYKSASDTQEDTIVINPKEISDFFTVISQLKSGNTSFDDIQRRSFAKVAKFILEAIGYYDVGPKIEVSPEIENALQELTQTIEDIDSNRVIAVNQGENFATIMTLITQKNGFTLDFPSPIDLLSRLYSNPK